MAFFDLAKNKFGIKSDEDLTKIFNKFVESNPQIHPLALGNVNRTHNLIRQLAGRLLKSHNASMKEDEIAKIVDYFTEKLYSHQYFIGRKEAKEDLGVRTVIDADNDLAKAINNLYNEYVQEMSLGTLWNPELELGGNFQTKKDYSLAFIENTQTSNRFELSIDFKKGQIGVPQQTPQGLVQIPQEQVMWKIISQGWK
jgi:hypothetical protein